MAGRSFTLPPLKLTRRPAYGTPKRENLHQGVRVVETPSNQRPRDKSDNPNALPSSAMASSSVSMDLESETSHEDEQTMYTIESKTSVAGWEAIRKKLLFTVTESVGMPVGQMCVLCRENCAVVRCQQCGPQSYYCQACVDTSHSRFTFLHAMEQWTVRYLDLIMIHITTPYFLE